MRVEALTIYDSTRGETLLSRHAIDSRTATASGGLFALVMLIVAIGTYILFL
jgi:hypothetical protein